MSNELKVNQRIVFSKDEMTRSDSANKSYNVSLPSGLMYVTVTGSNQTLDLGDVDLPGIVFVKNLSDNGYIELGPDGSNWFISIPPDEGCTFRVIGTAIHARSNMETPIEYAVFAIAEDQSSSSSSQSSNSSSSS